MSARHTNVAYLKALKAIMTYLATDLAGTTDPQVAKAIAVVILLLGDLVDSPDGTYPSASAATRSLPSDNTTGTVTTWVAGLP